jgi:hypothetical protein
MEIHGINCNFVEDGIPWTKKALLNVFVVLLTLKNEKLHQDNT